MNHPTSQLRNTSESAIALIFFCAAATLAASAQTFTSLANFDGTNGFGPSAALVQGVDGNLYGITGGGGVGNNGVVFKASPSGTISALQYFCTGKTCALGQVPEGSLVLAYSGALFGVAGGGGANFTGTVFRSTPDFTGSAFRSIPGGAFRSIYSFCSLPNCADGDNPYGLIQAMDGNFYGATYNGGTHSGGSIFKITAAGQLTTLYSFCAQASCADGAGPGAPPIQASNGNFYGTTFRGGANGQGTVYELTPGGILSTLYTFCSRTNCADGSLPGSRLVQASKGDLYGTTTGGGTNGSGSIFKITSTGTLTTLYSFCSQTTCPDGQTPNAELIQANDGNLYGTTQNGGTNNVGTIFKITVDGALTTLHSFDTTDGEFPNGALVQATNGKLYGTTAAGGSLAVTCNNIVPGCGTIFSLDLGLPPLVRTLVPFAQIGGSVVIYGTDLSAATSVKFNGVSASFTIVSSTEITATVPAGATPGKIQVVTPAGTISSTTIFRVRS